MSWPKLLVPVFLTCAAPALAGKVEAPADLISTRMAFAAAISSNNEAAAAALTSFPLKNTVYKEPKTLTRTAFAARFAEYRHMEACIKKTPFVFERGAWRAERCVAVRNARGAASFAAGARLFGHHCID